MGKLGQRARWRWNAMGAAGRIWWAGAATVATAAVLVLGATSLTDAASQPGGGSDLARSIAPTVASGNVASNSGSMAGMSGGSTGAGSSTPGICPNVTGTTTMSNGMVMAPVPLGPPTAAEQTAADQLVAETTADVAKYESLPAALAAGYVPATNPDGYEVHYANWQIVKSGDVLDPDHPSSLVYANTVDGPVLLGAMYLGAAPCQPGPDVGGPLTQWHAHDNLCLSGGQVVGRTDPAGSCATGVHNTNTYFMLHVWVAPSLAATHQFQPDLTRAELAPIIETGQP
ncbi:MAG: hypothetical protein ACLQRH_08480 [Acidimicrobiales bacterium]